MTHDHDPTKLVIDPMTREPETWFQVCLGWCGRDETGSKLLTLIWLHPGVVVSGDPTQRWTWVHICWPNPTHSKWTQPNPIHDFLNWHDPTQPTFRNPVLRKNTVNSLTMSRGAQSVWQPEQHGVSEIVYQSTTHAYLNKTVYDSLP